MEQESTDGSLVRETAFVVLLSLSLSHLFNDTLQSLISAIYPLVKDSLQLSFKQIGFIALTFQFSSSVFQPVVGRFTDKYPQVYSLPLGMTSTMVGIFMMSQSTSYWAVLVSVALIGFGSAIFHPEASRLAYFASGGRFGLAQSLFQVGGNFGSSLGPLLAAMFVAPYGQRNVGWFALVALTAIGVMIPISRWYAKNLDRVRPKHGAAKTASRKSPVSRGMVILSVSVLLLLIFSKYVYMTSLTSYYTFYLIHKFELTVQQSQYFLFAFLFAIAAGTLIGGPIGDKIGRKYVIWVSILGTAPFTLYLPYAQTLWGTCVLTMIIGVVLASAFSAILVYAQELLPGRVGTVAGLFFGLAFGIAGIASAVLGTIADARGIEFVYHICSYLPLLGLTTIFLPNLKRKQPEVKS